MYMDIEYVYGYRSKLRQTRFQIDYRGLSRPVFYYLILFKFKYGASSCFFFFFCERIMLYMLDCKESGIEFKINSHTNNYNKIYKHTISYLFINSIKQTVFQLTD